VGFFYNPNIHPYREFRRRIRALETVSQLKNLEIVWDKNYGLRPFLRRMVFRENRRCEECYYWRLLETVKKAEELRVEAFTTTLLYSRYQGHNLIKEIAEDLSYRFKVPFFYHDFREGWEEGQEEAKRLDIYRQPYCGCIYSEQERYDKKLRKRLKRGESDEPF
jgi:predicted adenine nucleotide alpha hydrolase (AANH) superfamily ATPase